MGQLASRCFVTRSFVTRSFVTRSLVTRSFVTRTFYILYNRFGPCRQLSVCCRYASRTVGRWVRLAKIGTIDGDRYWRALLLHIVNHGADKLAPQGLKIHRQPLRGQNAEGIPETGTAILFAAVQSNAGKLPITQTIPDHSRQGGVRTNFKE